MRESPQPVRLGDIVLVRLDPDVLRPLIVSSIVEVAVYDTQRGTPTRDNPTDQPERVERRICGTLCCEPADHTTRAFRGALDSLTDPARLYGRPDRQLSVAYGESLAEGPGIGQWRRR